MPSCMENGRQTLPSCPLCAAWSFLSGFSHAGNGHCVSVSGICMPADTTMCRRHPWKPDASHESWPGQTGVFPRQTCFFPLDMVRARIRLSFGSMAAQSQAISEPVLTRVSYTTYPETSLFFFFFGAVFLSLPGLNF